VINMRTKALPVEFQRTFSACDLQIKDCSLANKGSFQLICLIYNLENIKISFCSVSLSKYTKSPAIVNLTITLRKAIKFTSAPRNPRERHPGLSAQDSKSKSFRICWREKRNVLRTLPGIEPHC
jgi:hypothetical protein